MWPSLGPYKKDRRQACRKTSRLPQVHDTPCQASTEGRRGRCSKSLIRSPPNICPYTSSLGTKARMSSTFFQRIPKSENVQPTFPPLSSSSLGGGCSSLEPQAEGPSAPSRHPSTARPGLCPPRSSPRRGDWLQFKYEHGDKEGHQDLPSYGAGTHGSTCTGSLVALLRAESPCS